MRLGLEPDLAVVGEAADGEAALRMAQLLAPNVVIMDVQMPGMDGIAATEQLRRASPGCAVVMFSLYDDAHTRSRAADAGACGFVCKAHMDDALVDAIRAARNDCGDGEPAKD